MATAIIAQTETVVTVSSLNFLTIPSPARPDFDVYVPLNVNSIFDNLQLAIPTTDTDSGTSAPDQNQPTTGTFDADAWRSAYTTSVMASLADNTGCSYTADLATPAALKSLFEKIVCELFLGFDSSDIRFSSSGLTIKTDTYIAPWLNGDAGGGGASSWGQKVFDTAQFGTIATQLVTARKYERVAADGPTIEHGQIQLAVGDSIGVRVKLQENADNFLHINFYLRQTV